MNKVERIDFLFQSVMARFFAIPARRPASGAVTFAQIRVLWILDLKDAATMGDVARELGITNSTATELVDRLVRGGYLVRKTSAGDRRCVLLSVRAKGRAMLADFARRRRERFEKLVRALRPGDIRRMAEALESLNEVLERWRGRPT